MKKQVLPVVHFLDYNTALEQSMLALNLGADGVFLISHKGEDKQLFWPAMELKRRFPDKLFGVNLLHSSAIDALTRVKLAGLDMVWVDAPGVSSAPLTGSEINLRSADDARFKTPMSPMFFGSVAFKYQPQEADPGLAAKQAWKLGMIPTTSGEKTGSAPSVEKIQGMRSSIGEYAPLAVASGMTAENVCAYLPYVSHFLVATGVSEDEYHFDRMKMAAFIEAVHTH